MEAVKGKRGRIVIFSNEFYPRIGGIGTYVEQVAAAATDLGYRVELIAPRENGQKEKEFNFSVLWRKGAKKVYSWYYVLQSGLYLVWSRPRYKDDTLFLGQSGVWEALLYTGTFSSLIRTKHLIIALYGTDIIELSQGRTKKFLLKCVLRKCDRITVLSEYAKKLITERYPQFSEKTIVAYGAVRGDLILSNQKPKEDGKLVVITVARVLWRKGQLDTVKAIGELPEGLRNQVEYWVVGPIQNTAYFNQIKKVASEIGVDVVFKGDQRGESLAALYAEADIFVMSSRSHPVDVESFGLAYLEASAIGIPVLGYDLGGVKEAVLEGKTGFLVEEGDINKLSYKLEQLLGDKKLRVKMGHEGMQWAKSFSWEATARKIFE